MSRIDLFVSPEEYAQVRALGASWDGAAKCWYIEAARADARFAAWLPGMHGTDVQQGPGDGDWLIESSDAYIARAATRCQHCRRPIEVVCLYCRRGSVPEGQIGAFSVQCLWAVDSALRRQLQRWPGFRRDGIEGVYLNHCAHCGGAQDETRLHEEPGQPFHDLGRSVPSGVKLEPLAGRVRMSGDYGAEV